jgi:ABC-type multidrug transport system fused ATPase/permease subunit
MKTIKKILFLLSKKQKKDLSILTILLFIGLIFEMVGLGILLPVIGILINNNVQETYPSIKPLLNFIGNPTQQELIILIMGLLILIYLIKSSFLLFLGWQQSKFSTELSADLSKRLFEGYLSQDYEFHLMRNTSEFLRNIKDEIYQFTYVSQAVIALTLELSVIIGAISMLFFVEPIGALIVTLSLFILAGTYYKLFQKKIFKWGELRQYSDEKLNKHLLHGFGGIKELKLSGRESHFINLFSDVNNKKSTVTIKQITLQQIPRLYLELLGVIGLAGLIISFTIQGKPIDNLIPILGLFVAAAFRMIPSANRVMGFLQSIRYAQPVVNLLYEEFKLIQSAYSKKNHEFFILFKELNKIEIKNLSFSYIGTNKNLLNEIGLTINKGESVGIVGSSGSGKSTLVDLILGLLIPKSGQIMVNDLDIDQNIRSWQNLIGYVPQNVYLADDTLANNIAFGVDVNQIDYERLHTSLKSAQLDEFVKSLPEGINSEVGERGSRISGGQRQRIGIARALYHSPQLLVFDEATSALDNKTELEVMEVINSLKGTRTILIIAHRLTTIENCDKVFEINEGKINQLR